MSAAEAEKLSDEDLHYALLKWVNAAPTGQRGALSENDMRAIARWFGGGNGICNTAR
jgi:hypothetical protein